jgi:hypothetical protein
MRLVIRRPCLEGARILGADRQCNKTHRYRQKSWLAAIVDEWSLKDGLEVQGESFEAANHTPLVHTTFISHPPQQTSPHGPEIEPQVDQSLRAGSANSGMLSVHGLNTGTRALTYSPVSRETTVRP